MISTNDLIDVTIGGIDTRDYPDFSDAYVEEAFFTDGTPLTDEQMDEVTENNPCWVHELVYNQLY